MKCSVCLKTLELEESKFIGLCYACRKAPWDKPSILAGRPTRFDPFDALNNFRIALNENGYLTDQVDQKICILIELLKSKR